MRANINLLWVLGVFFLVAGAGYTVWSIAYFGYVEWVGTVGIFLSAILMVFVGYYLSRVFKAYGGVAPEDDLTADIDDGDPEIGHFSPWSWWPILLAAALGLIFTGLAVGFWIAFIGLPLVLISVIGLIYEHYRGNFAR